MFPLKSYLNKGARIFFILSGITSNKIGLSKKTRRKLKSGNEKSINLVTRQTHKFNNAIILFWGIYDEGLGK